MTLKCWSKLSSSMPFTQKSVSSIVDLLFKESVDKPVLKNIRREAENFSEGSKPIAIIENLPAPGGIYSRRSSSFSKRNTSNKTTILLEKKRQELVAS
jgi:hypothetical protein